MILVQKGKPMTTPVLEALEGLKKHRFEAPLHHEVTCDCERCLMARTIVLNNLGELIGLEHPEDGIYGSRGWSVLSGVASLTLQYSDWGWMDMVTEFPGVKPEQMIDYLPYDGGDAWLAAKLLARLPETALADRQNYGPSLDYILRLTAEHSGEVLFGGYLIGPQRFDERISSDAIYVTPKVLGLDGENPDEAAVYKALDNLNLDALEAPDEISPYYSDQTYWRFWWD
ncbi:hypothetical protein HMPREF9278_1660 [Mobiluncus mulieris FB024-16]|nr:hypothetical protein HMPREF9278_1660 [Mobiluncus mulieris FB024-16]